jgi:hypothetical protein
LQIVGVCDIGKFIDYNFALFKYSLYYSIGREFMKDRIATDRINQYTVLTMDRATQLLEAYEKDYTNSLLALHDVNAINEDNFCWECKKGLTTLKLLP